MGEIPGSLSPTRGSPGDCARWVAIIEARRVHGGRFVKSAAVASQTCGEQGIPFFPASQRTRPGSSLSAGASFSKVRYEPLTILQVPIRWPFDARIAARSPARQGGWGVGTPAEEQAVRPDLKWNYYNLGEMIT